MRDIVMITGASSGLGKQLVKQFVSLNNHIVVGIGRSKGKLSNLEQEIKESGGSAFMLCWQCAR